LDLQVCPECGNVDSHIEFNRDEDTGEARIFIPARLDDNPFLDRESYVKSLRRLDPITREQLLNGSWQISVGGMLRREWFVNGKDRVLLEPNQVPTLLRQVRVWDLAATARAKQ
jgi:hypothetical protein